MNTTTFYTARTKYNQHGFQTVEQVSLATGIQASMIRDLESKKKERKVGYQSIVKLAKHYNVTTDYLMGLEPYPSREPDIQTSVITTGLSEESVAVLQFIKQHSGKKDDCSQSNTEITRLINRVLSGLNEHIEVDEYGVPDPFYTIFNLMEQYINSAKATTSKGEQIITIDYGKSLGGFSAADVCRSVLLKQIEKELDRLRMKEESDNGKT